MTTTTIHEFDLSSGESVRATTSLAGVRGRATVTVLGVGAPDSGAPAAGSMHPKAVTVSEDAVAERLRDLGFWPGTKVDVVCSAPFGGAAVYRLRGFRVALRSEEAACVRVALPV